MSQTNRTQLAPQNLTTCMCLEHYVMTLHLSGTYIARKVRENNDCFYEIYIAMHQTAKNLHNFYMINIFFLYIFDGVGFRMAEITTGGKLDDDDETSTGSTQPETAIWYD